MTSETRNAPDFRLPTRWEAVLFRGKTLAFQVRKALLPSGVRKWPRVDRDPSRRVVAESRSPLFSPDLQAEEFALQSGKIQNLRVAASFLNGVKIPAGEVFSFWAQVPRPMRRHGFVEGRELREGCLVPSIGGGICQLSNALYDAALRAGFEIVERHAHSKKVPGSMADSGRDATVFWNYVDLKFRSDREWQMEVQLSRSELVVRFFSDREASGQAVELPPPEPERKDEVRSCDSCGMTACHLNRSTAKITGCAAQAAWAVDGFWPEFGSYLSENRGERDLLLTPLATGRKWGRGRYSWPNGGFESVTDFPGLVIRRSLASRKLAAQGAERQRAYLRFHSELAERMVRKIPHEVDHVVVSIDLLPYFWKSGVLGGREFDVLMTRWPLDRLQEKLNAAAARWPDSPTLADFRVEPSLCEGEREALSEARRLISPHAEMLRDFPEEKRVSLPWDVSPVDKVAPVGSDLIFPATTAGRNGAWEVREAIRELGAPLKIVGPNVESDDFWDGCDVERLAPSEWLDRAGVVVFPAWISHRPARLLQALERGIPVITTVEAGLSELAGVTTVPTGDPGALAEAVGNVIRENPGQLRDRIFSRDMS